MRGEECEGLKGRAPRRGRPKNGAIKQFSQFFLPSRDLKRVVEGPDIFQNFP